MKFEDKLKVVKSGDVKPLVAVLKEIHSCLDTGCNLTANGMVKALIILLEQ